VILAGSDVSGGAARLCASGILQYRNETLQRGCIIKNEKHDVIGFGGREAQVMYTEEYIEPIFGHCFRCGYLVPSTIRIHIEVRERFETRAATLFRGRKSSTRLFGKRRERITTSNCVRNAIEFAEKTRTSGIRTESQLAACARKFHAGGRSFVPVSLRRRT